MRVRTLYRLTLAGAAVAAMIAEWNFVAAEQQAPAGVVHAYFQAAVDKRCDKAFGLLTDPVRSIFGTQERLCRLTAGERLVRFQIGECTRNGDTARVLVTLVRPALTTVDAVTLSTVDGQWRIAAFDVLRSPPVPVQ